MDGPLRPGEVGTGAACHGYRRDPDVGAGVRVALARETTGHDWYATGKLSLTELLTGLGFDDRAPVEYRTRDGEVMTLTRDGFKHNGDALLARDHVLRTGANAAELGAWCGFGGAMLFLALLRRPKDERRFRRAASAPERFQRPEARSRFAPPGAGPSPAAPPYAGSAPENRPAVARASRPSARDSEARDAGKPPAGTDSRQPDAAASPPRAKRKRGHVRWI